MKINIFAILLAVEGREKPVFTYRLKEGVSEERLGMYFIQKEGIVDIIRAVPLQKLNSSV